jgi:hypothetical protein
MQYPMGHFVSSLLQRSNSDVGHMATPFLKMKGEFMEEKIDEKSQVDAKPESKSGKIFRIILAIVGFSFMAVLIYKMVLHRVG